MKTPEQERLLCDVLNEDETYSAFRAQLRQTMLTEARRQYGSRRGKQLLALAACVAIALTLLWLLQPRNSNDTPPAGLAIVHSIPLKPEQIVTTANHNPNVVLVLSRNTEVMSANFEAVRTVGELPPDVLTDQQLLDLFKGRAVALVNLDTGKKLVFLDEE
jgi:hypothetical protein